MSLVYREFNVAVRDYLVKLSHTFGSEENKELTNSLEKVAVMNKDPFSAEPFEYFNGLLKLRESNEDDVFMSRPNWSENEFLRAFGFDVIGPHIHATEMSTVFARLQEIIRRLAILRTTSATGIGAIERAAVSMAQKHKGKKLRPEQMIPQMIGDLMSDPNVKAAIGSIMTDPNAMRGLVANAGTMMRQPGQQSNFDKLGKMMDNVKDEELAEMSEQFKNGEDCLPDPAQLMGMFQQVQEEGFDPSKIAELAEKFQAPSPAIEPEDSDACGEKEMTDPFPSAADFVKKVREERVEDDRKKFANRLKKFKSNMSKGPKFVHLLETIADEEEDPQVTVKLPNAIAWCESHHMNLRDEFLKEARMAGWCHQTTREGIFLRPRDDEED